MALTRNNSGVRLLAHHGAVNPNSFVTRLSNSVGEVNPQLAASVLSLKQKGQIKGAESQRSLEINTLIKNASSGALNNTSPDGTGHQFHKMLNDKSITNLMNIETSIGGKAVPQSFNIKKPQGT